ncbi:hypothetical protein [Bradyrhizobium sp. HKCCYLR20261]|uniref:hypothetical protein n=1 Tax=Bradyrhizobium sp. HKCCYLR20261 TaxID=3420760 RepID=UPI003EBACC10
MGNISSRYSIADTSNRETTPERRTNPASADFDLLFLPPTLLKQCRSLIASFHDMNGFGSLPDMLWKFRLAPLIERNADLRLVLRKASTTRSAKKAKEGFVEIATKLLAIEVLASSFAGWSAMFPREGEIARDIRQRNGFGTHMPLMDFYLHPPKQISTAAIAALAPRAPRSASDTAVFGSPDRQLTQNERASV